MSSQSRFPPNKTKSEERGKQMSIFGQDDEENGTILEAKCGQKHNKSLIVNRLIMERELNSHRNKLSHGCKLFHICVEKSDTQQVV